jgi:hypothetical protein
MSYHQDTGRKKNYTEPTPSGQKGKPGIKPKSSREKDLIGKESGSLPQESKE